jgi:transcriptional regulator with XRE-family HTH domain
MEYFKPGDTITIYHPAGKAFLEAEYPAIRKIMLSAGFERIISETQVYRYIKVHSRGRSGSGQPQKHPENQRRRQPIEHDEGLLPGELAPHRHMSDGQRAMAHKMIALVNPVSDPGERVARDSQTSLAIARAAAASAAHAITGPGNAISVLGFVPANDPAAATYRPPDSREMVARNDADTRRMLAAIARHFELISRSGGTKAVSVLFGTTAAGVLYQLWAGHLGTHASIAASPYGAAVMATLMGGALLGMAVGPGSKNWPSFGELVLKHRKEKGWPQQEVADRVNSLREKYPALKPMLQKTISRIEKGRVSLDDVELDALAEVLGLPHQAFQIQTIPVDSGDIVEIQNVPHLVLRHFWIVLQGNVLDGVELRSFNTGDIVRRIGPRPSTLKLEDPDQDRLLERLRHEISHSLNTPAVVEAMRKRLAALEAGKAEKPGDGDGFTISMFGAGQFGKLWQALFGRRFQPNRSLLAAA